VIFINCSYSSGLNRPSFLAVTWSLEKYLNDMEQSTYRFLMTAEIVVLL